MENQKKHKENVKKTEKLGSKESLASPSSYKPITRFRWLHTRRIFDLSGKLLDKSNTKAENKLSACYQNLFMARRLGLFQAYDWESEVAHKLRKKQKEITQPKSVPNYENRLHLLHMDLCGPMRVESINGKRFNKTPYELINNRKLDISFLHVFWALCYPKNDHEDTGTLGAKGDKDFFIWYSTTSCAYRVYNQRIGKVMEMMNVTFDDLSTMAFKQLSSKPELQGRTSGHISSGVDHTYAPLTISLNKPTERDLELLFESMYDNYMGGQPSDAIRTTPAAPATLNR
ncbi:hypothetical protein Tco_1292060 [Tanacetum coccineum]